MRIMIATVGTRGDIQPFIALGQGLQAAGHEVTVCAADGYRSFIETHGPGFAPMGSEVLRLSQQALSRVNGLASAVQAGREMMPAMRRSLDEAWDAARAMQPDLIVYHPKSLSGVHIAEKLNIPAVLSLPLPLLTPTSAFPSPALARLEPGGWFNRMTYHVQRLAMMPYSGMVNDFRRQTLGLPPLSRFADGLHHRDGTPLPILYSYSRHVLPVPEDFPPHVHVTGYWFLDRPEDWQPDPGLVSFLNAGPPPVYIGFGSMAAVAGSRQRASLLIDALATSGQRGLLDRGWGDLEAPVSSGNVMTIDNVPHDWLFPRVAAVVHHGGAGTVAAGLRAGKPTLICPVMADQPFWGQVVHRRGVGPAPIPLAKLTAVRLASGINELVTDPAYRERATALGEQIRSEDGVAVAVDILSRIAS